MRIQRSSLTFLVNKFWKQVWQAFRWDFKHQEQSVSLDVEGQITMDNINLMVEAALAGVGIAWVPQTVIADHLQGGRLINLLPQWSPNYSGLCLYYPANRHPPIALRLFVQAVRDWSSQTLAPASVVAG